MKIIKDGKMPALTRRLECRICGCIFEVEKGEYTLEEGQYLITEIHAVCPCCGKGGGKREIVMR